jgi:hypothetical protein
MVFKTTISLLTSYAVVRPLLLFLNDILVLIKPIPPFTAFGTLCSLKTHFFLLWLLLLCPRPLLLPLKTILLLLQQNFVPKKFRGSDSERFPLFRGRKCSFRGIPGSTEESIPKLRTEPNGIMQKKLVLKQPK